MATCMPKHHLLYFENGLSRPKSKSYSRLRLDRTKAGKKLPVLPATRDSSSDGQEPSGQDRSTMAATVVAGWGTPAATPAELGASIIPSELVSTWLNCALSRLALPNAHVESEPETGTARRFSEPIVPTATSSNMHNTSSTFDAKLSEEVKIRFSAWKSFQLKHFSEEEKLLMPLTQMLAPTPLGRCRVVHRHLICPSMERSAEEFIHFIGWCTGLLSRHGSDRETPEVATRIFVCALQSVSSAAQWAAFQPVLMYHCKEEIWKMLVTQYNVLLPFGDELLLGTINAEFQGPPPMGELIKIMWLHRTCIQSFPSLYSIFYHEIFSRSDAGGLRGNGCYVARDSRQIRRICNRTARVSPSNASPLCDGRI